MVFYKIVSAVDMLISAAAVEMITENVKTLVIQKMRKKR